MSSEYQSQLKCFAVDKAVSMGGHTNKEDLLETAKAIAEFCYCTHEDAGQTSQHLYNLLQKSSGVNIHHMIMALRTIREQLIADGRHAAVTEDEKQLEAVC